MNEELIPTHADSYDSLTFVHTKCACIYKRVGYTPLQVVRDISTYLLPEEISKCTYVGRLDPMAEGWMHVLWNGDMEEKAQIASSDKIYEIEVVFGVGTDTGDVLGLISDVESEDINTDTISEVVQSFIGPFTYAYPKYSSPNMKATLKGEESEERKQKGTIKSIKEVSALYIENEELEKNINNKLSLCKMDGDFRLDEIKERWNLFFTDEHEKFLKVTLQVECSSGTYMRTLAEELGKKLNTYSFALSIKRIGIKNCSHDIK